MAKRRLDNSWKKWLKENLERQCNPDELYGILVQNRFSIESIKECMGEHFPEHVAAPAVTEEKPSNIDYKAISQVRVTRPDKCPQAKRFPSDLIQLYTIEDFMSAEECDAIVEIITQSLRASTITTPNEPDKYYRTSSTSDLALLKDKPAVDALDEKIARMLGIRTGYSEGIQGQHYKVGQEFKRHTDFFEPDTSEYNQYGGSRGNRTWTFMVYLNNVAKGGGTQFVEFNHIFMPKKGKAVIWNNLYPDGTPNYDTLHAGMPVEEGHKTIITKWFRERGKGPMFYDDP